jgi:hypothetical protein
LPHIGRDPVKIGGPNDIVYFVIYFCRAGDIRSLNANQGTSR